VGKLKISKVWMKNKIKKVLNKFPYIRTLISNIKKLESNLENYKKIYGTWVPPGHYYSPIPSLEELELKKEIIYDYGKKIQAIDLQLDEQYKLLKEYSNFYKELDFTKERNGTNRYFYNNPSFREPDGIFLYSFLMYNEWFRIIFFNSLMLKAKNNFIKHNMPLCLNAIPGSIYLKKLK
jgi:hypothetical protein